MRYFNRIDGLRAIAVGAVMLSHYVPFQYQLGIPWGGFGVNLFFVISGFLITRILRTARQQPLAKGLLIFYWRRFLRIFPLYYFCLLWISVLGWGGMDFSANSLWHWAYASNWKFWLDGQWGGVISHFWSLAVEEQFYLIWPLLFLSTGNERTGFRFAISLVVIGLSYRVFAFSTSLGDTRMWDLLTPACLEPLGLGAILAHQWKSRSPKFLGRSFSVVSFTLLLSIGLTHIEILSPEWRYHMFVVWCVLLIWFVCRANWTILDWFILHPVIRYIGMISYGLYVWHNFMGVPWYGIADYLSFPDGITYGIPGILGKSMLTVLFATATWYGFEKPLLRYKSWFNNG